MDRRTRVLFAMLFAAIVVLTAVAAILLSETGVVDPDRPAGTTDVTGVVVGVDSSGLADVRGFTLRLAGGELVEFSLRALTNGPSSRPATSPSTRRRPNRSASGGGWTGADRLAIRLEDAPS